MNYLAMIKKTKTEMVLSFLDKHFGSFEFKVLAIGFAVGLATRSDLLTIIGYFLK